MLRQKEDFGLLRVRLHDEWGGSRRRLFSAVYGVSTGTVFFLTSVCEGFLIRFHKMNILLNDNSEILCR